jgi:hypothetical protein
MDYSEAILLMPDNADVFYNRGVTRRKKGDIQGANEDFERAKLLKEAAVR